MHRGLVGLIGVVVGAAAGYVLRGEADDVRPAAPAYHLEPDPREGAASPAVEPGAPGPLMPSLHGAAPTAAPAAGGGTAGSGRDPGSRSDEALRELRRVFSRAQAHYAERIRELEEELERARAAWGRLPEPEVLRDLRTADLEELLALGGPLREIVSERLLLPDPTLEHQYGRVLALPASGTARILVRGQYEQAVTPRGGGAYWSFVTRSNSYNDEPDLELQDGHYGTSFYGGTSGFLLDMGRTDLEDLDPDAAHPPADLDEAQRASWTYMWQDPPPADDRGGYALPSAGRPAGLRARVPATIGHTYLLRAILPGEHDVLVAFHAASEDAHGHHLVWRILKQFPMEKRRR
jgi:hypothetical protein